MSMLLHLTLSEDAPAFRSLSIMVGRSTASMRLENQKVKAVLEARVPKSATEMRSFRKYAAYLECENHEKEKKTSMAYIQ